MGTSRQVYDKKAGKIVGFDKISGYLKSGDARNLTEEAEDITGAHVLICFHSVCKKCVDGWNESDKKSCPVCQFDVPKDVISNKLLQEMIEKPHSESTRKGVCGMHTDTQASRWCHQCSSLVCDECVQNHYKLKATSTHNLVDASTVIPTTDESLVEYRCKLHPTMQFEILCLKCDMMTCRNCQLEYHKQHSEYEFIADQCKTYKHELIDVKKRICETEDMLTIAQESADQMEKQMRSTKETLHKQITELQQRLVRAVNERCKELLTELDTKIDEEIRVNRDNIKKSSLKLVPLKHCLQIVDLMLLHASDNTIIHSKKHVQKCLDLHRHIPIQIPNLDVRNDYHFHPGENLENLVSQIKRIGHFKMEPTFVGSPEVYRPIIEKMDKLNQNTGGEKKSVERPVNQPARIQLRQDLQSPEGLKSMERVSSDSRSSASPEVGGMPHWHTPQGPHVSQVKRLTNTAPTAVIPQTNQMKDHLLTQQLLQTPGQVSSSQASQSQIQLTKVPPSAYPPVSQVLQKPNSSNQRMMPPNTAAPMKHTVSDPPQHVPPVTVPAPPVAQFVFANNQLIQTRNYQSTGSQRRPNESQIQNFALQNMLGRNNVTLQQVTQHQQNVLSQHPQVQQQQQQPQIQQQVAPALQPPPYLPLSQHQTPSVTFMGQTYFPGSTHTPYPQL
ncbi:hypothetical protein GE061_011238 [Apolygus lucorum]|uniref:B box-type domain-containing protein n=1 Tax=Apolygus lucorum TaxID=248454 RepID=A0A8S9XZ11_APOLU|nr:hypothetical protein GE061_011238 [Apolygus lucorum]